MAVTNIEITDLPNRIQEILAQANAGEEIILTEQNTPRAKLVPLPSTGPRKLGLHPGAFQMADDFDAPLPDDFWLGKS